MKKTHCIMFSLCWLDTDTVIVDYTQLPDVSIWNEDWIFKEELRKYFKYFRNAWKILYGIPFKLTWTEVSSELFWSHVCVNSYYNIVYHLTTNLYMSKHPGMKDCNVCSIEGQGALPRCKYIGNSENKEGSLRNLNLF